MQSSCKAGGEGDLHNSSVKKPKTIRTNLMGRNFLGCPWRAHDEVNVSHEFVIEHQRVPASRGGGRSPVSRGLPLARCPLLPPAAPGLHPAHPPCAPPARPQVHRAGASFSLFSLSPQPGEGPAGLALTSPAAWDGRIASWRSPSCCC